MANEEEKLEVKKKAQEVSKEELENIAGGKVKWCGFAKGDKNVCSRAVTKKC